MLANGCGCSIGDQLHPRGEMNRAAYARIGTVYREIEKLEPFVEGSRKVADIGIVVSTDFFDGSSAADEGAMRMLMELHYSFDFIPVTDAFEKYALIILPDRIEPDAVLSGKLRNYLAGGGKVIATCRSTDPALGVEYLEDRPYEPAYLCVEEGLIPGVEPLEYVCYGRGAIVTSSLPVKAYIGVPYFNRTADCFSSHRQFPFDRIIDSPAILLGDRVGYCAFPLFADYIENGNLIYRDVIGMLLNTLLPEPTVSVHAPSSVECTVRTVGDSLLIFLLHYIPERRTKTIDIIDSRQPILDAEITLHGTFSRAELLRCGSSVPAERTADGRTRFRIPRVDGFECIRLLK